MTTDPLSFEECSSPRVDGLAFCPIPKSNALARLSLTAAMGGFAVGVAAYGPAVAAHGDRFATYANPVNLPYRYQSLVRIFREAADPTVVRFKGRFWLFASHSKGYWHSIDLLNWTFIQPTGYDVGKYAPTVLAIKDKLYVATSENTKKIWVTNDPMAGVWTEAADISPGYSDPDLFLDDDARLFMYDGLSGTDTLHAFELDPKSFQRKAEIAVPASRSKETRGWEVVGDRNERLRAQSYIEGSWMTKYRGRYYLQYAAPGTEYKTYADGVLVADQPMGPFRYEPYSPFSVKPTGFISGAGHGSTFQGEHDHWWHMATMTVSVRFPFERRLGLFPTHFTSKGELIADTYLGDYPHYLGGTRGLTGWMLLSRKKPVTVSSALSPFEAEKAVDEDVRTWWSATSGNPGEYIQVDLAESNTIQVVQINFADQDSKGRGASSDVYNYVVETSDDASHWQIVIDHSSVGLDAPHDYQVLRRPVKARFVRLTNVHAPDGSKFSLSDFRVFGNGHGSRPARVTGVRGDRDPDDGRKAHFTWSPVRGAEFYVVRFGINPDALNQNYQVYDGITSQDVASLNVGINYCFAVDAVNKNGIKSGSVQCFE